MFKYIKMYSYNELLYNLKFRICQRENKYWSIQYNKKYAPSSSSSNCTLVTNFSKKVTISLPSIFLTISAISISNMILSICLGLTVGIFFSFILVNLSSVFKSSFSSSSSSETQSFSAWVFFPFISEENSELLRINQFFNSKLKINGGLQNEKFKI